jgi:hypothetical protein
MHLGLVSDLKIKVDPGSMITDLLVDIRITRRRLEAAEL